MAMDSIEVSTQELVETAAEVKRINGELDNKLQTINSKMQALKNSWNSDGAEVIRKKMEGLKPRFEEYKNIVNSYAEFLNRTAAEYENLEATVQRNAEQFR